MTDQRDKPRITPKQLARLIDMFVVEGRLPEHSEVPDGPTHEVLSRVDVFEFSDAARPASHLSRNARFLYEKDRIHWNYDTIDTWRLI